MHPIRNRYEFDRHRECGRFLVPEFFADEPIKNAGYMLAENHIIELEDSQDTFSFFELSSTRALGKEVTWKRYDAAFLTPKWVQPTEKGPYAIWDLSSGKRILTLDGYHLGELRGARLLQDNQLVTWGRDFVMRVWDLATGAQRDAIPLPALLNAQNKPTVSSRSCSDWTDSALQAYISQEDEHLPFKVTLMVQTNQASRTESFIRSNPQPESFSREVFDRSQTLHRIPDAFLELEEVEAGYSDSRVLADGRLLIGGITYGSPEHTYIWDGGLQLIILYTSLHRDVNFEIEGEVAPGLIQFRNYLDTMTFNVGPVTQHQRDDS